MNSLTPVKSKETMLMARFKGKILLKKAKTFKNFLMNFTLFSPQMEFLHLKFHSAKLPTVQYNSLKFLH